MDRLADLRGEIVAQLDVLHLEVGAVLDIESGEAGLVVVVRNADGGNGGVGILGRPGVENITPAVGTAAAVTHKEQLRLGAVDNIEAQLGGEEHAQAETFVGKIEIQAEAQVRIRVAYDTLVVLGDDAVAVDITVADTPQTLALLHGVVGYFLLAIEQSVSHIAIVDAHRLPDHKAHIAADGILEIVEFDDLVLVVAQVETAAPREAVVVGAVVVEIQFHTHVAHIARVGIVTGALAGRRKHGRHGNHVLGGLQIPIEVHGERVVEEAQIESDIGLCGGLPLQILVARRGENDTRNGGGVGGIDVVVGVVGVGVGAVRCIVVAYGGVTVLSPTDTNFTVREIVVLGEETLRRETPCSGESGEPSRIMPASKAAGGISTHRGAEQVAVVVVVIDLGEDGEQCPSLDVAAVGSRGLVARPDGHEVGILERIVLAGGTDGVILITDGLRTEQGIEMVVAPYIMIGGGVRPCPCVALAVVFAHAVHIGGVGATPQGLVVVLHMLDTDIALQVQSLDPRINFEVGIAEDTPTVVGVVLAVVNLLYGVGYIGFGERQRAGEIAVCVVDRDSGVLTHGHKRNAIVGAGAVAVVAPLGNHQVLACLDPFADIEIGIDTHRVAFEITLAYQTVLIHVVAREIDISFLRTVRHAGVHIVRPCGVIDRVLPIGAVGGMHFALFVEVLPHHGLPVDFGVERMGGRNAGVPVCLPIHLPPFLGIEHTIGVRHGLRRSRIAQVDRQAVFLGGLGGDDNHTVGGTRAVDTRRRRILQHLHGGNVRRVERVHVLRRRHTVYYIEWLAGVHRTHTTNADAAAARAGGCVRRNLHARQTPLNAADHVGIALRHGLVHIQYRHRTRQVGFALRGIARNDQLLELLRFLGEKNMHRRLRLDRLLGIAYIGYLERCTFGNGQGEIAVEIGNRTVLRTFLQDRHAYQRFSGRLVSHCTTHSHCLRRGSRGKKPKAAYRVYDTRKEMFHGYSD